MSEELFDKYLSDTLTANEEEELHGLLQDDHYGQALVEYALEIYTNTKTASDLINGNTSKERRDLVKKHTEPLPLLRYLIYASAAAAIFAVAYWVTRPVSRVDTELARIGEKANIIHGGRFRVGDNIKTAEPTHFEFVDGSKIKLSGEVTVLSEKEIYLKSGTITINAVPQENGRLTVKTDNAMAAVMGTSFTLSSIDQVSAIEVSEGKVEFSYGGKQVVLSRGSAAVTNSGSIISSPKGLSHVHHQIYINTIKNDPAVKVFTPMESVNPLEVTGTAATACKVVSGKFVNGRTSFTRALQSGTLEIPGTENFELTMPCTLGAWVNINEFENYPPIFTKGDSAWRVQMNVNGKRFHVGFGDNKQFLNSKKFIQTGEWYFITFTGSGDNVKVYVNGQLENEKKIDSYNFQNESTIMIGGNKTVPHRSFNGLIGDVFILGREMTALEIESLYKRGISIK